MESRALAVCVARGRSRRRRDRHPRATPTRSRCRRRVLLDVVERARPYTTTCDDGQAAQLRGGRPAGDAVGRAPHDAVRKYSSRTRRTGGAGEFLCVSVAAALPGAVRRWPRDAGACGDAGRVDQASVQCSELRICHSQGPVTSCDIVIGRGRQRRPLATFHVWRKRRYAPTVRKLIITPSRFQAITGRDTIKRP